MAPVEYVASALVMGFLLTVLGLALVRARDWQRYILPKQPGANWSDGEAEFELLRAVATNSTVWVLSFILLSLGIGAGAVLFVSGTTVPASLRQNAWLSVVSLSIALVAGYIFWGTYQSSRYRGLDSAQATLAALWVWGILFIVAVVLKLVTA
ncbi:hypothetical protein [Haladaptatus caseinilyticus]|uniref:hypothetical protein n=1 Tax=Haladaptatus caseinilyticus TaxID=2993314 RepID=UPI00224AA57C|nr:hypothetical protein [Haladaptatus caseinilyticus]